MTRRTLLAAATVGLALGAVPGAALAQGDLLRIVVGFPPGTTPDVLARKLAETLGRQQGRTVVVENRAGAGGQLAVTEAVRAPQDGRTLLLTPMAVLGVFPHTYRNLPYDPQKDLKPVSNGATYDLSIGVGPAVPESVRTVPQLIEWYRQHPDKASMGSPATGSSLHFLTVILGRAAGLDITHVGYRGSTAAIQDMLGGTLPALSTPLGSFLNQPRLRMLASTGRERSRFTPEVGTLAEQGYPDLVFSEWYGFYVGAGVPDAEVAALNAALRQALDEPEIIATLATFGMEASPSSPEELDAELRRDSRRWGDIVRSIGFTADS